MQRSSFRALATSLCVAVAIFTSAFATTPSAEAYVFVAGGRVVIAAHRGFHAPPPRPLVVHVAPPRYAPAVVGATVYSPVAAATATATTYEDEPIVLEEGETLVEEAPVVVQQTPIVVQPRPAIVVHPVPVYSPGLSISIGGHYGPRPGFGPPPPGSRPGFGPSPHGPRPGFGPPPHGPRPGFGPPSHGPRGPRF